MIEGSGSGIRNTDVACANFFTPSPGLNLLVIADHDLEPVGRVPGYSNPRGMGRVADLYSLYTDPDPAFKKSFGSLSRFESGS